MFAAVLVGVLAVVLLVQRSSQHEVDPGPVDVARASPAEAATALSAFVAGVAARDAAALGDLAPGDDRPLGRRCCEASPQRRRPWT